MMKPHMLPPRRVGPMVAAFVGVAVWGAGSSPAAEASAAEQPALVTIAEVKNLSDESLAAGRDVRVRGVVTWHNAYSIAVQDASAGIWITEEFARRDGILDSGVPPLAPTVAVGMEIEVVGVPTRAALFSTMLMPRSLLVLGRRKLPTCRPTTYEELFSGATDHLRVEARGIVQGFRPVEGDASWMLFVDGQPGEFGVLLPRDAFPTDPSGIVDAEVLFRGVSGACYNFRGEFLSPRIHVNGRDDVVVERAATVGPFSAPKIPLADIAGYRSAARGGHRQRVEGVVTLFKPGEYFYIQDGGVGVRVETRSTAPLRPGDRVEVSGFVSMNRRLAGIKEAVVDLLAATDPPAPLATTIDAIREKQSIDDGLLVTVPGRVLDVQVGDGGSQLAIVDGGSRFQASLDGAEGEKLQAIAPGSAVSLTGVVRADLGYDFRVRPSVERIGLLLRSAADVVVVRPPSWWTPRRLLLAVAGLTGVLLAAFGWVIMLRREVATQSAVLAQEMRSRRDAAVEFDATLRERNRLAANLHDTLLQTLGGIGYQLEACAASGVDASHDTPHHVGIAQRMVDHAMGQLHDSVWALRSLPLRNQTFAKALGDMAARMAEGHDATIDVDAQGQLDEVPDFVAGNLLLVIQEAVYNAIRHGHPTAVGVVVRTPQPDLIEVVVSDDGRGFVCGSQPGRDDGHFGIEGMRERVERLGGSLSIESRPGAGTTLRATVSTRGYDGELA